MTTALRQAGVLHSGRGNHGARVNVAFSANGYWGACLRTHEEDLILEQWSLASEQPTRYRFPEVAVDRRTHPLPLDDGRMLLIRSRGSAQSGRHSVTLLHPDERGGVARQRLGDIPGMGGYLVPGSGSGELGLLVTLDNPKHSTIWRLSDSPPEVEPVVRVPGALSGGVWLDTDEGVLAVNQSCEKHRCSGIAVDLPARSWRRTWSVSDTSLDRVVLASPRSKLLIVSTNVGGPERLGWAALGESEVRFPETLHRAGYVRQALALDDAGERLLVREEAGAVSRLFVYRPADDSLTPVASPSGTISAPASWVGDLIRCRFSAPDQPPTIATLRLGTEPLGAGSRWTVRPDDHHDAQPGNQHSDDHHNQSDWAQAELTELSGPAGPIEAIIYGGTDWRSCPHLVLALHGGPLSGWRFEFDLLFQSLAQTGIAVLAPNYRGSTGYGEAYLRSVVGQWGGPDLEDVVHLGRSLMRERESQGLPEPVLLGTSYGGFLALLAACHEPRLWSACVALAPFLSGPSLYECAAIPAQRRIDQLGGLERIDDALGPRDVLRSCPALTAPLLLIHGSRDDTIPVQQSRLLRRRLSELGRIEGVDFEYLEADSNHEEVALASSRALREKVLSFCLARPG